MKKTLIPAVCLVLACLVCLTGVAETLPEGRAQIFSASNPIPDIFDSVSPSVLVLACTTSEWDPQTDTVTKHDTTGGSAVYIDSRGYFITNYHIVEDADELELRDAEGTVYEAYVVGYDEAVDVAVLKLESEFEGTPVPIGSSGALRVGEMVIAIGTPVDEKAMYNTCTFGIVSGLNREDADPESTRAVGLIQTDAAINPGNSGGALLNAKGEMVGIPFMKYMGYYYRDSTGEELVVYEGLAFAVPMDVAWPIASSIIETGSYSRPRFGVSVQAIDGPEEPLKNYPPAGLKIVEVERGGSGDKAGLRADDVVTHVNGTRIYNFREYTKIIDKLAAGTEITLTIARYKDENGEALRKPVTLDVTVLLELID